MIDPRFGHSKNSDGGVRHRLSNKRFDTVQAAYDDWLKEVPRREELAGRPLTREELVSGITRPDPRSTRERRDAERRRRRNSLRRCLTIGRRRNRPSLGSSREKNAEAESQLSPRDRQILRLEREVAAEKAASNEAAARESALSTDAARRVSKESLLRRSMSPCSTHPFRWLTSKNSSINASCSVGSRTPKPRPRTWNPSEVGCSARVTLRLPSFAVMRIESPQSLLDFAASRNRRRPVAAMSKLSSPERSTHECLLSQPSLSRLL